MGIERYRDGDEDDKTGHRAKMKGNENVATRRSDKQRKGMSIEYRRLLTVLLVLVLFVLFLPGAHSTKALAQVAGEAVLFSDNFERGNASAWRLMGAGGRSGADLWQVEKEPDGNWVLSGAEHTWGTLVEDSKWSDFTFRARIKIMPSNTQGLHINYRLGACIRYFIAFHSGSVYLGKTMPCGTHTQLVSSPGSHNAGQWYTVEIVGKGNHIKVYVDRVLRIDYSDPAPVLTGGIGIETLDGSHAHVDDVVVSGPPPPPTPIPPPGFTWAFTGGPRGGIGYDIRIRPDDNKVIWVTDAYAGTHRSTDGGLTWQAMNSGITARAGPSGDAVPIFSLAIDPNNPNIIWAGTQGMRGVFKSTDGGNTWTQMDRGVEDHPVTEIRSFTIEPGNSSVVYMGGNYRPDPRKLEERGFIYKTVDGGKQWTKILDPGALVRWILVDPTNTNIVFASTGIFDRIAVKPEGILKSTDGGRTWSSINDGLTSLSVGGLAMHPQNPQVLFATTGKSGAFLNEERELYGAVFKTTDGGQHWRKVYPPVGRDSRGAVYSAVAFAPSDPNIVYIDAGHQFLRSADGGETWQRFDTSPRAENRGTPIALAVHPSNPDLIYMNAYDGGVFRSNDGGSTWVDASAGYSGSQSWDVAIAPNNPGYVVVGSKNGVHLSFDGGLNWQGRNTEGWINNILAVAINPTSRDRILAGNEINGWIRMTMDGGQRWQEVLPALGVDKPTERISIYQIAFAPSQPNTVYAATGIAALTIGVSREIKGRGVYKSTNGGQSWFPTNKGLEDTRLNMLAIGVAQQDPNLVFIGTLDEGVFKSTDGGATWVKASKGLTTTEIRAVATDPNASDVVYVGTDGAALFKSVDGGKSWQQSSAGMDPQASIRSIVIDPANSQIVYAADRRTGFYRSVNGGVSWARINQGLTVRAVNRLAISADGKVLYAATEGGGVFRVGQPQVVPTPTPTPSPNATASRTSRPSSTPVATPVTILPPTPVPAPSALIAPEPAASVPTPVSTPMPMPLFTTTPTPSPDAATTPIPPTVTAPPSGTQTPSSTPTPTSRKSGSACARAPAGAEASGSTYFGDMALLVLVFGGILAARRLKKK